jgi:hypothetical protein
MPRRCCDRLLRPSVHPIDQRDWRFGIERTCRAEKSLGLSERDTVEVALELVAFRRDLAAGARALKGLALTRID